MTKPMKPPFRGYVGDEPYVCVSYSHINSAEVYPEIHWLHENACFVWYDEGIAPGSKWRDEIAETIIACSLFVFYLSPESVESEECMKELSFALDQGVPILTIFLEQFKLSPGLKLALQNRQAIEKYRYNEEAYRVKLRESVVQIIKDGEAGSRQKRIVNAQAQAGTSSGFDQRYQLHNEVARVPNGVVFRALDLVRGRTVTIKRDLINAAIETNLATEFKILASLRHPNIVTALDFGVDDDGREYLVMDLQENALPLAEAAANQPVSVQVDLLSQSLRALHYLHRKKMIHCAIQPQSVVVADGRVKLLDFAWCRKTEASSAQPTFNGDSTYLAPELSSGAPASDTSDLYALGLVAYSAFVGAVPKSVGDATLSSSSEGDITSSLRGDAVDPRLAGVLAGLLAHDPNRRFQSALEAFAAFDESADGVVIETALTRESALQTAKFVGREAELEQLHRALESAKRGRGETILICGESGVGKSRLVGELKTMALVSGFRVMRGHAVDGDTGSYRIWDEITKHLDILTREATGSSPTEVIGKAKTNGGDSIDENSFLKLESSIQMQNRPTLIVLEDLHWAGTESVKLLSWLALPVRTLPVVIVGTYRPDEAFDPRTMVEDVREIKLGRLSQAEVTELASTILGKNPDDRLSEFLAHETEGNSLFIIETLRVLAEHAGALDQVGSKNLPDSVLSGGMRRILNRRVSRLAEEDMELLRIAAVVGRAIDPELMAQLAPNTDIEAWAQRCTQEAVLEYRDASFRFSHEKLREFILAAIDPGLRPDIHRSVAVTLESINPDPTAIATALTYHWGQVGDDKQEARFAFIAGEQTLAGGALPEAIAYFKRVDKLLRTGVEVQGLEYSPHAAVQVKLSEAYFRLGKLAECTAHSINAIRLMDAPFPKSQLTMGVATLIELVRILMNRKIENQWSARAVELSRVHLRLTDVYFYALQQLPAIWSTLRTVNEARLHGNPGELAIGYSLLGSLASAGKLDSLARNFALKALKTSRITGDILNKSYVISRLSMQCITNCDWNNARRRIRMALKIARRCGELRLVEEMMTLDSLVSEMTGNFEAGLETFAAVRDYARRIGDRQAEAWGAQGESVCLIRLGRSEEARALGESTLDSVHDPYLRAEAISTYSILAIVSQRAGETASAINHIEEALRRLVDSPPMAHWMHGVLGCLAEAVFSITNGNKQSPAEVKMKHNILKSLKTYAKYQTLGQPFCALWRGVALVGQGKIRQAESTFTQGIERANSLNMPYEEARLQLELMKLDQQDATKLESVIGSFTNMGCQYELDTIRSLQTEAEGL